MIIRTRKPSDIRSSDITAEDVYVNRRRFIRNAALGVAAFGLPPQALSAVDRGPRQQIPARFQNMESELDEDLNPYSHVTTYNNFYEFGTGKEDPSRNSGDFQPTPWTVRVEGHVNKPGDYQLEDFIGPSNMEDRVYRMRCVEAWSIVVPWRGFPLYDVINRVEPTGDAKFVEFKTVVRPEEMPGQRSGVMDWPFVGGGGLLDWPYVEGLRLDEAMNPLTLMTTGVYGMDLPNQNGAPLRLITPWKYGFKGIKSIVSMNFVSDMPRNTWWLQNSHEYGFYANVNPEVDHPRWSQARERRLGELSRRPTLMFNGYADQVQSMYEGMDLTHWY
jgi:sulfoxide reductase catalytic subunit YedY